MSSQVRTGVAVLDVARYGLYWTAAVVLPGMVVARALLGVRRTIIEDLAIAAATGISLETVCWVAGVVTGLGPRVRFWWIPVLVLGVAVPAIRRRVLVRVPDRIAIPNSAILAAAASFILIRLDVAWLRATPLPPHASGIYPDVWWQLSIVQELMRYAPPQVPQVAGLPFHYHYFANAQMASSAVLSGVAPEVITFRLWIIPVALTCVGLAFAVGRLLTGSQSAGAVSALLAYGIPITTNLWPDLRSFGPANWPIGFTSPSQTFSNIGLMASALGFVMLLRGRLTRGGAVWLALIVAVAAGEKSTIIPILFAGTVFAGARAVFVRAWPDTRRLLLAAAGLIALQLPVAVFASAAWGGEFVLFGSLRASPVFEPLAPGHGVRAVNDGILLDSINSPKTFAFALLATAVLLAIHAVRLAGVAGLLRRPIRGDLVTWWFAGGVLGGYGATMSFDHVGISQMFFAAAAAQLGAVLTVSVMWNLMATTDIRRRTVVGIGIAVGCVLTLTTRFAHQERQKLPDYGTLDRILLPIAVVAVFGVLGWIVWRRQRSRWPTEFAWIAVYAAVIGTLVPAGWTDAVSTTRSWLEPVAYRQFGLGPTVLDEDDLRAGLWLRAHSHPSDVVATNAHCTNVVTTPYCQTRGFWISGISGRRVLLEGWAFTEQTQAKQGVGGRTYDTQPSPFIRRSRLNAAVFSDSDRTALAEIRQRYGVRWIFAVHRAGPTPSFPPSLAKERFTNDAVTIFEVSPSRTAFS